MPFARLGLPEALRLRGRYAWLRGKPEAARRWWEKSLAVAKKLGARYEAGATHLDLGQRFGDRAHLEEAQRIFTELGAQRDLARVRQMLSQQ